MRSVFYALPMRDSNPGEGERLRQLLADAIQKLAGGSADKLGRLMGYTNGGFIREIVNGKKPVRRAIIERMHQIEGGAGWFNDAGADVVIRDPGGNYTIVQAKTYGNTAGEAALQLAHALAGVDARQRRTIAQLVATLISEGPSPQEVAAIDALAPGAIVNSVAPAPTEPPGGEWRTAVFKLVEANPDPVERERLVAMLLAIDAATAKTRTQAASEAAMGAPRQTP